MTTKPLAYPTGRDALPDVGGHIPLLCVQGPAGVYTVWIDGVATPIVIQRQTHRTTYTNETTYGVRGRADLGWFASVMPAAKAGVRDWIMGLR